MKDLDIFPETKNWDIVLINNAFDCFCQDEDYIHFTDMETVNNRGDILCTKCNAHIDEVPNSRLNEVTKYLEKEISIINQLVDKVECFSLDDLRYRNWCYKQLYRLKDQSK